MFVLMCGLPSCGKSAAVDIIAEKSGSPICVIRPEDFLPDNINDLSPEEEKDFRIECWQAAMALAEEEVEQQRDPSEAIILDCANSKFRPLESLLRRAKRNGHRLVVLYVNARPAQCATRAGDNWVGEEVAAKYVASIKDSLPKFKSKCDQIIIIENTGARDTLEQNALAAWSRLCPTT